MGFITAFRLIRGHLFGAVAAAIFCFYDRYFTIVRIRVAWFERVYEERFTTIIFLGYFLQSRRILIIILRILYKYWSIMGRLYYYI